MKALLLLSFLSATATANDSYSVDVSSVTERRVRGASSTRMYEFQDGPWTVAAFYCEDRLGMAYLPGSLGDVELTFTEPRRCQTIVDEVKSMLEHGTVRIDYTKEKILRIKPISSEDKK